MILSRIFVPKRDEVTGQWMMWYNGELHNLYLSPYNVRQIKSRRVSWAGHVALMGEKFRRFCWKSRRKKTTRKIETYMVGCDLNGS
jgi:hypothetical protein